MSFTYIKFKAAMDHQGFDRSALPYRAWWQPWAAYYALTGCVVMAFVGGYTVFLKGNWDVTTFIFSYAMIGVVPVLFVGWKLIKGTKWMKPGEIELTKDQPEIEEYERNYVPSPPRYV